ncbi:Hypothetical protein R9X50_00377200 [Acrodontium crateriforme]|uniref:Uncharacterized protein n=1 Tax=Acrodontium crateriforme TaxID=150365 RepID=A0AAQ3M6D2_9PEZI|nr:Hypothetical protein R9X50_00377200 [Acrodontium crateriforme]
MDSNSGLSSRAKRSTTNLADLRLAPLSTRFIEPSREKSTTSTSYLESPDVEFGRQHSSYIQGKSAPTTPGILSRSSSRSYLGGGLSRRGSLYDNEQEEPSYEYAAVRRDNVGSLRVDVGSGRIPKAKSEAALAVQPPHAKTSVHDVAARKKKRNTRTPRTPKGSKLADDDWLTRTGAAANALLQESKGQSWLQSRESSTTVARMDSTDDDEDDQYEEMAELSASTARFHDESALTTPRVSKWGSRYGSRPPSHRASRRGSVASARTPLAGPGGSQEVATGYFDGVHVVEAIEPDWVDRAGENSEDDEVARLSENRSFGLGSVVDKLMNFRLFKVDEREESTEDESEHRSEDETEEEARQRMLTEAKRRREAKEKLTASNTGNKAGPGTEQDEVAQGWQDAAWLFSVASKALF